MAAAMTKRFCRHCRERISPDPGAMRWVHYRTGSIWCADAENGLHHRRATL
jgi:hypothetical protein